MSKYNPLAETAVDNFEAFRRWYFDLADRPPLPEWQRRYVDHFLEGKTHHRRRAVLVSHRQPGKWADTVEFIAGALLFGVVCYSGPRGPRHLKPGQPTLAVASPRHDTELLEDARNMAATIMAVVSPANMPRSMLKRGRHE